MTQPENKSESLPGHFGTYRVIHALGEGGMGKVYEAVHEHSGRHVALKVMTLLGNPIATTRFRREAQAAALVHHRNVVEVFEVGEEKGIPFLVMELLEGITLHEELQKSGPFTIQRIAEIFLPVLSAVASAHKAGVIHRDLKPSNIFLVKREESPIKPMILDFGISKISIDDSDDVGAMITQSNLTRSESLLGTPGYMSLEMIEDALSVSAASDQYALGVMLYECATQKMPFSGNSAYEIWMAIKDTCASPPSTNNPKLPKEFDHMVLRAMHRDPQERYPSVRSLGRDLLSFADEDTRRKWRREFSIEKDDGRQKIDLEFTKNDSRKSTEQTAPVLPKAETPSATIQAPTDLRRSRLLRVALLLTSFAISAVTITSWNLLSCSGSHGSRSKTDSTRIVSTVTSGTESNHEPNGISDTDVRPTPGVHGPVDSCGVAEVSPNNDRDHATSYPWGTDAKGCLQSATDVDFYQFTVPRSSVQGGYVQVSITDVGDTAHVETTLYAAHDNGELWKQSNNGEGRSILLYFAAKAGATFRLKVAVKRGMPYTVWVVPAFRAPTPYTFAASFHPINDTHEPNDDNDHATPITIGQTVHGYLFAGYEDSTPPQASAWQDRFKIRLPAAAVTISLTNVASSTCGRVTLYDPLGVRIGNAYQRDAAASVILRTEISAEHAGDCFVVVEPTHENCNGITISRMVENGSTVPTYMTQLYSLTVTNP